MCLLLFKSIGIRRAESLTPILNEIAEVLYFMLHTILVHKLYREQQIQQSTRQSNFDRLSQDQFTC